MCLRLCLCRCPMRVSHACNVHFFRQATGGGGFTDYRILLEFPGADYMSSSGRAHSTVLPPAPARYAVGEFSFEYRDVGFTAASIGVRIALLAVTIGLSGVWYRAYRDVRRGVWFPVCGSWHHSPRCVLPHQAPARMPHVRWVSLLLFVMLCWQNPLVVVGQLFPRLIAVHAIAEVCTTPMRCGCACGRDLGSRLWTMGCGVHRCCTPSRGQA